MFGVREILTRWFWALLVPGCILSVGVQAAPSQLMGWHYNSQIQALEFALNGPSTPQIGFYNDPPRLVIDMPGVQVPRSMRTAVKDPQVVQIRSGQANAGTGRLVIELAKPLGTDEIQLSQTANHRWRLQFPRTAVPPLAVRPNAVTARPVSLVTKPPVPDLSGAVRLEGISMITEGFLLRTSGATAASVRRVDNPPRLVVDLPGTILPNTYTQRSIEVQRLGVERLRVGQFQALPPITRVVLDVQTDTLDWEAVYDPRRKGVILVPAGQLALAPQPAQGTSLISAALIEDQLVFDADGPLEYKAQWDNLNREYRVEFTGATLAQKFQGPFLDVRSPLDRLRLFPSEGKSVTAILKIPTGFFVAGAQRQSGNRQFSIKLARMATPPNPTTSTAPNGPTTQSPVSGDSPLVIVDAGHGGSDPGALGPGGLQEKDLNLKLSRRLGQRLTELGYRVAYTRQDDRFITLQGRVQMAEQAQADIFVSIHHNASENPSAQGIETYYLRANSSRLATMVHRAVVKTSNRLDRGVHQARFHVIRQTTMPAILVESGYVSNKTEAQVLNNDTEQQSLAVAIAQAIDRFIKGKR